MRRKEIRKGIPKTFDPSTRVFPYPTDFASAFPELESGWLEYRQSGPRGDFGIVAKGAYNQRGPLEPILPCENICRRGGFELFWRVRDMIRDRETQSEIRVECLGFEGRLRPRTAKQCGNVLHCRITVEYKPATP